MSTSPGFHRPHTLEQALALKARLGASAAWLGGGTLLNSLRTPRPVDHVIALDALGLDGVRREAETLVLGAGLTLQGLLDCEEAPAMLRTACGHVHNRSVRNAATLGGLLGSRQPWSDLLPALIALEATVEVATPGGTIRRAVLDDFYEPRPGSLILAVHIDRDVTGRRGAVGQQSRAANDHATVAVAVTLGLRDGAIADPIVAVGGVGLAPSRLERVEQALAGAPPPDRAWLEALVAESVDPAGCVRGGPAYKRQLAAALTAQAVLEAASSTGGA